MKLYPTSLRNMLQCYFFAPLEFVVDRGNPTEIAKATSCEFNFDPRHGSALDEICGEGAAGQAQICNIWFLRRF